MPTPLLLALLAVQLVTLVVAIAALMRKPQAPAQDPRQAEIPNQLTRLDARAEALDKHLRDTLADLRRDTATEAQLTRTAATEDFSKLRAEITTSVTALGGTLHTGLAEFRADNRTSAEALRTAIQQNLEAIGQRLSAFVSEANRQQSEAREALNTKLTALGDASLRQQEQLRGTVSESLTKLNEENARKLEEMRLTVDEKLHATLQTRLTESFGQVTDQLTKVHAGLGEMTKLSAGVDDLSRIFTNVKSRGQFAEAMLDNLLKQMLAPSQFVRNAQVRPDTDQVVEFAVRFPGINGEVLLPIDSKFPRESSDRLETAYESGGAGEIAAARKVFETAIRTEAKRIASKYINEPITTPNAIMFLPTEGLYAEVMRRDGLYDDMLQNCHVMIAGPSNLSAVLTSFQMIFALVNLQKKGGEVWNVLASARSEFDKFGGLMEKMDKQVGTVQNTIRDLGVRTRAINRTLRDVSGDGTHHAEPLQFPDLPGIAPLLAASGDEE